MKSCSIRGRCFLPFLTRYSDISSRNSAICCQSESLKCQMSTLWSWQEYLFMVFRTSIIDIFTTILPRKRTSFWSWRNVLRESLKHASSHSFWRTTLLPGLNKPCQRGHVHVHTGPRFKMWTLEFMCKRCGLVLNYWRVAFDSFWETEKYARAPRNRGIASFDRSPG